jgi:hypothetical protein
MKRKMRIRLCEAQNWHCAYCGAPMEPETATIEHVIPISVGGANKWENMVAACGPCNLKADSKYYLKKIKRLKRLSRMARSIAIIALNERPDDLDSLARRAVLEKLINDINEELSETVDGA